nr:hypothetical protein [Desulfobacter vibrioformis]
MTDRRRKIIVMIRETWFITGDKSPYPTVVNETIAKYKDSITLPAFFVLIWPFIANANIKIKITVRTNEFHMPYPFPRVIS